MVNPNNNLEADVYDSALYSQVQTVGVLSSAVMYLGLLGVLLGLFLGRFIGVEMAGVVQVAFIGLMTMSNLHPLLSPLTAMGYITGLDQRASSGLVSVPNRVYALQYSSELFSSLNYSMALLFLPLLVGGILFALSKCLKTQSEKLRNWALTSLCDYEFTATMFLAYHAAVGTLVMVMYMAPSSLFAVSLAEAGVFLIIAAAMATLLKMRPSHFGQYKSAFKDDAYSQHHYIVLLFARVLEAAVLVAASGMDFVAFVAATLPVALIVLVAVKKPYTHAYNNGRAIANEAVVLLCLGIYGYYRCAVAKADMLSTLNSLLPYVVVGLLLLSELMNLALMGKFFFDTRRQAKSQVKQQMEEKVKIEEDNVQVEKNLKEAMRGIFVQKISVPSARQELFKKNFKPESVDFEIQ